MAYAVDQRSFYVPIVQSRITKPNEEFRRVIAVTFKDEIVDMSSLGVDANMEHMTHCPWYEMRKRSPDILRAPFGDMRWIIETHRKYPVSSGLDYFMWWGVTDKRSPRFPRRTMTHVKLGIAAVVPSDWSDEESRPVPENCVCRSQFRRTGEHIDICPAREE